MNLLERRRAMMNKPLPYDARVEYLQSDGTQYIDTHIEPHQDITIKIKWRNYPNYQNGKWLIGSGTSTTDGIRAYISSSGAWRFGAGSVIITTNNNTVRTATIDKTGVVINGTTHSYNNSPGNFSSNVTIKLLASASGAPSISALLYYVQIDNNGVLVSDFFPVRVGSTGYLYDAVSGQLFGNSGTGDFIVGPDVA